MVLRAIALCLLTTQAAAHEWYDGWCCSGQDCAPVPASTVQSAPGGWLVTVLPGQHPLAFAPISRFVPFDSNELRPSQDDEWHVCVYPRGHIRCVYQPEGKF